jgi:hypothetical protein
MIRAICYAQFSTRGISETETEVGALGTACIAMDTIPGSSADNPTIAVVPHALHDGSICPSTISIRAVNMAGETSSTTLAARGRKEVRRWRKPEFIGVSYKAASPILIALMVMGRHIGGRHALSPHPKEAKASRGEKSIGQW